MIRAVDSGGRAIIGRPQRLRRDRLWFCSPSSAPVSRRAAPLYYWAMKSDLLLLTTVGIIVVPVFMSLVIIIVGMILSQLKCINRKLDRLNGTTATIVATVKNHDRRIEQNREGLVSLQTKADGRA